jgi:putative transcriptional regulator
MPEKKKFLKGQLLLDSGQLRGSFFQRTVVLICQHDAEGAFGLVLNRPSGSRAGDIITGELPEALSDQPVFVGGPVQPSALSYLHSSDFLPDANVLPNLNVGHSLEDLVQLGETMSLEARIRMFAGYSGWSPGQLEDEIRRDAWFSTPASRRCGRRFLSRKAGDTSCWPKCQKTPL